MEENKSVIQHLEDIESNLEQSSRDKTISEMIGENFDNYLEKSTIYYFESDERKFSKEKKKQSARLFIISILYFLPLLFHVVVSILFSSAFTWNIIIDFLLVLCPISYYIYSKKQKNKKIADSKWNIHNHTFYKYENKLGEEDSTGLLGKILLVYKILSFIIFALSGLFVLFGNYEEGIKPLVLLVQYGFILVNIICLSGLTYDKYYYPCYIFDTADSYVLYSYNKWEKISKQ